MELDIRTLERIRRRFDYLKNHAPVHLQEQMELYMQEWVELQKMNEYAFRLMERTTNTYVQTVSATATKFANEQANNSRKLTGYAISNGSK